MPKMYFRKLRQIISQSVDLDYEILARKAIWREVYWLGALVLEENWGLVPSTHLHDSDLTLS